MNDVRKPTRWLNYRGDQRQILDDGPKGPNTYGELLYPVTADYNQGTNRTRVGFTLFAPERVSA